MPDKTPQCSECGTQKKIFDQGDDWIHYVSNCSCEHEFEDENIYSHDPERERWGAD